MVVFQIDEVTVYFPYDFIYPEQYAYIRALKHTLDAKGHAVLEMPTGTGKTVALLSLLTSYQLAHPRLGKILYCTRTVPEMEKALLELKGVIDYRIEEIRKARETKARQEQSPCGEKEQTTSASGDSLGRKRELGTPGAAPLQPISKTTESEDPPYIGKDMARDGYILGVGLSARRNMCINPAVYNQPDRERIDEACRQLTAPWVRQQHLTSYNPPSSFFSASSSHGDAPTGDIENLGLLAERGARSCGGSCGLERRGNGEGGEREDGEEGKEERERRRRREALESNEEAEPGHYSPSLCAWYENLDRYFAPQFFPAGVYTIEELKIAAGNWRHPLLHRNLPFCPYFLARRLLHIANVVVLNYQYILDPKVSQAALLTPLPDGMSSSHTTGGQTRSTYSNPYQRRGFGGVSTPEEVQYEGSVVVFDEAHNIDNVCIEALSVNINRSVMEAALRNLSQLAEKIEEVKKEDAERLREEYENLVRGIKRRRATEEESASSSSAPSSPPSAASAATSSSSASEVERGKEGQETERTDGEEAGGGSACVRPEDEGERIREKRKESRDPGRIVVANETLDLLASPLLPDDALLEQAVPGSIRKAEHFVALMRRIVSYLKSYIKIYELKSEGPLSFLHMFEKETHIDASLLKFFYDRLKSLFNTLQITEVESYAPLTLVADFCTLVATYCEGFILICDPYPEAVGLYDPLLQLSCLDASLAMQPVLKRFQSLILTSGTISPLELYPKLLNFVPVITESFPMSLDRNCICPLIVARGSDQIPLTSKFEYRHDMNVLRNYSNLLIDLCKHVPDGLVCFFTSYSYMESVLSSWYHSGVLAQVLDYKLIFIETKDVVATTLALHNFRRACECGRGAVFFSIARGKVAEGIDFDRHFGRCVVLFGVPFQYTLSRVLKARLDFIREHYQIPDNEFLTFDAMRQAAQCVGRVIRSKNDYGLMIFADARYSRIDKRSKLPPWILKHLDNAHLALNTETAISVARTFLRHMSQPPPPPSASRLDARQLQQPQQQQCWELVRRTLHLSANSCVPAQPKEVGEGVPSGVKTADEKQKPPTGDGQ
uniref:DNA 5'-3' helicase n=1 Tax=Toxoplasma gondii COUG TaxID=1074873 RepID=A0A2G8XNS4_TOXGO|nr:DNA excision repair helicase [Toxoplasma gondii COUG]